MWPENLKLKFRKLKAEIETRDFGRLKLGKLRQKS
jgi:hypothetical protein